MKKTLFIILLLSNYAYGQIIHKPQHDPPEVVNLYTEVLSFDICKNQMTVTDATFYNPGDTVLLIQMKGAVIDTSNTAAFGSIIDYKNAGNYEFNYISQKTGNTITFKNTITKGYDVPDGVVQLIRVPYFKNPTFTGGLTCLPWDGTKGGVLAVMSRISITCDWDIDVNGMGFRGGEGYNSVLPIPNCNANGYTYPAASQLAAVKGESIVTLTPSLIKGKGCPAGGGGGGLSHNSGGGGGGNAGMGGFGGFESDTCGAAIDNRGIGGKVLSYTTTAGKIFMGSGGGAGHADNVDFIAPAGGNGGGIIILITGDLFMFGHQVMANGQNANNCVNTECNDGMGGGGAGGTILLSLNNVDATTIENTGGTGANMSGPILPGGKAGPGGGGGGGAFYFNQSSLPASASLINNAGSNGVITTNAGNPWGATAGTDGISFYNLVLPFDAVLFKPNIDSVRIKDSLLTCNSFSFKGFGYTNTNPIISWYWDFGDGNTANTQNTSHAYSIENTYPVKLVATDINGCKDSISTLVNPKVLTVDAGLNRSVCSNGPLSILLNGSGTGIYAWTPALYLNDSTLQNPTATINSSTVFYLTITSNGCSASDSVKIILSPIPVLNISKSNDINCYLPYAKLRVSGASQYLWSPSSTLNNSTANNPVANPVLTTTYFVTGTNDNICYAKDSIMVVVDFLSGKVELPNIFTPNNDGINDCFGIKYYRDVQNLVFIIYNRYGTRVFETKNVAECWDGYYKGQPADPGSYIYYLSAKTLCGDVVKKGSILLIR